MAPETKRDLYPVEPESAAEASQPHYGLQRHVLGPLETLAQSVSTMAPTCSAALTVPLVFATAGNGTWLAYLLATVCTLLVALCIARFAQQSASPGSLYTYATISLPPVLGSAAAWALLLAYVATGASVVGGFIHYANVVLREFVGLAAPGVPLAIFAVLVSIWIAYRDVKVSARLMVWGELASVLLIGVVFAVLVWRRGPHLDPSQLSVRGVKFSGVRLGLVLAMFSFVGFESATTLGEEATHAKRTIPRAIMACVVPVGLLYLFMTYLLVGLGRRFGIALDQLEAPFDTLARACRFALLGTASSAGIALSYFACTLGSINAGARTLYSLSEDGLFFRPFGFAHPVNATPHRAIALIGAVSIAMPVGMLLWGVSLVSCIDYVSQLAALGYIGSYFMVCLAAPFFLASVGCLTRGGIAASVAALVLLAAVLVQSVYPVPPAPACYLPYVFAAAMAAGFAASWWVQRAAA